MDYHSLEDTHKKVAAVRSAAEHATNPHNAVLDYRNRIGMISFVQDKIEESSGCARYAEANEEMLSLLPACRHPVNDVFAENLIFFDKNPRMTGRGYGTPEWVEELEKISSVPESLLTQILHYVRKAELEKIDLNVARG